MKLSQKSFASMIVVAALMFGASLAHAGSFPSLTLSSSGSTVQAIISNADANQQVQFYYPVAGSYSSVNIGTTDSNGYLTAQINPTSYGISVGNPVYVRVNGGQSSTATWPAVSNSSSGTTIYITQTSATLTIGQSTTITASNVIGSLSIPGNTNPSVVSANIDGNNINVTGLTTGTAAITVCATSSGCANINVTVQPSYLTSPAIYLNPSNTTINIGQNQTVAITGYASGPYYVSSNSNSNTVSAAVSGNSVILTGLAQGSSNITVCATGGQCGTMYATVSSTGAISATTQPLISSFTVSSNDINNQFMGAGTTLTLSFNANQPITSPRLSIAGTQIAVNGNGSGPYTVSYTMTGNESSPVPVAISVANVSGYTSNAYFWVSGSSASTPITNGNTTTVVSTPSVQPSVTSSTPGSYAFNRYLYVGMTAQGVADPDVTALQQRLKVDGLYSGPITGYFGPLTKTAVMAYQKKHGLSTIGVIGPGTRDLLNKGI